MKRTRKGLKSAIPALLIAAAACDANSLAEPESDNLSQPRHIITEAYADTARMAADTALMVESVDPQQQHTFGPAEGTLSRDVGDDTFNLNFWVDGRHITHRIRTLVQDALVIDQPRSQPDLIFEWAIVDDFLYGSLYGADDFIGLIGADRNNDGMINYPDEVIGFWGRCSLATNQTYWTADPATGKPRYVHWENYDSNEEEMYHYIYDSSRNLLKIFHRHKDGSTVQVYEGPPIQDPGKMPPPDPAPKATTTTNTTMNATTAPTGTSAGPTAAF